MSTSPLNSVQPDLGDDPDWDRPLLSELLSLHAEEDGRLRSRQAEININGTVFGGQLIGQCLAAAAQGLPQGLTAHHLQLCFLAPGFANEALHFEVRRLQSGRSFLMQQVFCTQGGRPVCSANVSFHRGEEGPEHAAPMPAGIPHPEQLQPLGELLQAQADTLRLDAATRLRVGHPRNIELRPVQGRRFLCERAPDGHLPYWVRAREPLPDSTTLHQAALGYLSDYWFPVTALAPHLGVKINTGLYIASLNHAIWFHAPLRADEWLFVDARVQATAGGRGLSQGSLYSHDGRLVATVMQETLFRGWDQRGLSPQ